MRKSSNRGWLLWLGAAPVVILIAASPFLLPKPELPHLDCEPPILEQVESQVQAIMARKDIPLQLPVSVNGHLIENLTLASVRRALLAAGFMEDSKGLTILTMTGVHPAGKDDGARFVSKDGKITAVWYALSGCTQANNIKFSVNSDRFGIQPLKDEIRVAGLTLGEKDYFEKLKAVAGNCDYPEISGLGRGMYEYMFEGDGGSLVQIDIALNNYGDPEFEISSHQGGEEIRRYVEFCFGVKHDQSIAVKIADWLKERI